METFSALLALCVGNSPVAGEFPTQRPVTRSFGVFFDLRLNKRLSKQSWGWWFETPSWSLWRHRNPLIQIGIYPATNARGHVPMSFPYKITPVLHHASIVYMVVQTWKHPILYVISVWNNDFQPQVSVLKKWHRHRSSACNKSDQ